MPKNLGLHTNLFTTTILFYYNMICNKQNISSNLLSTSKESEAPLKVEGLVTLLLEVRNVGYQFLVLTHET